MLDNDFALKQKSILQSCISDMDKDRDKYVKNPDSDFTRNRKLNFENTIIFTLTMAGRSLNEAIYKFTSANDLQSVSKQALIMQRNKLNEKAFSDLFYEYNRRSKASDTNKFKGHHVYAVDGTYLRTYRNPESDSYCAKQDCNQYLITSVIDVFNNTFLDLEVTSKPKSHEITSFRNILERTDADDADTGSIFLFDRLYFSFDLYETLNRKGYNSIFRVKDNALYELRDKPKCEFDIDITREIRTTQTKEDKELYKARKAFYIPGFSKFGKHKKQVYWHFESRFILTFRALRICIGEGKYETIITSLPRSLYSLDDIKELYRRRWQIETNFRYLKYDEGLLRLHCRKDDFIKQEIYAHFTMMNFSQRIMNNVVFEKNEDHKHEYQVNHSNGFFICKEFFRSVKNTDFNVMEALYKCKEPIREGRADKRKLKREKTAESLFYRLA